MKKLILIFLLSLAGSISCKKYEEGPFVSFRSAKHRIIGDWKVVSYTVDGVDSMQYIYNNHLEGKWFFGEVSVGSSSPHKRTVMSVQSDPDYEYTGEWQLDDNNKTIHLLLNYLSHNGIRYSPIDSQPDWKFIYNWEVIRLKNDDLKFRLKQGKIYEIHFKQSVE